MATVNKTHEKTKEQEEKEGWGWFTAEQMKTELKWSKPGTQNLDTHAYMCVDSNAKEAGAKGLHPVCHCYLPNAGQGQATRRS